MKNVFSLCLVLVLSFSIAGCGYTQKANLPNGIQSISVPPFINKLEARNLFTFEAGLETKITNAVRDRVIFDGNLSLENQVKADSVLLGKLIRFEQEAVGFDELERVDRFRLFVVVHITLTDMRTNEVIWEEPNFNGNVIYSLKGPGSISEGQASQQAIDRLARDIVDRIVEDW